MKLSEAARILGVDTNADKQTIEKAARQQIRKWHPDRWRNASEAEQKRAADEYSKVSKAQQTMQHPETADPELNDIPSPSYSTPQGFNFDTPARTPNQTQYQPQRTQYQPQRQPATSPQASPNPFDSMFQEPAANSRRVKYNEATSFEDSFGAMPDTMEQTLNTMHNADIEAQYKQFADVMKMSMSILASLILFIVSFILLLGTLNIVNIMPLVGDGTLGAGLASILPVTSGVPSVFTFGILTFLALIKMLSYDAFIAPLLANKIEALVPSIICGIDIVLCGIIGYAVSSFWPVPRIMYGMMILVGALFIMASVLIKMHREAR